jgi:general secretion pathway protein E
MRKLCPHCRREVPTDEYQSKLLNVEPGTTIYESHGCEKCNNTGFVGRQALFELVTVNAELQSLIHQNAGEIELEQSIRQKVPSIREAGFNLVREGVTTVEEVLRVTSV